jgi:AbrB family looped-hinge helix DNA binding protein
MVYSNINGCGLKIIYDPQILNNEGNNCLLKRDGEKMPSSIVDPRFRITIPREIRERFEIKEGDKVSFFAVGDQISLYKIPKEPLLSMRGILKVDKDPRKILTELKEEDLRDEKEGEWIP